MNKIFRVVWSKTKNSYVVVSEIAKRNGKCSSSLNKKLIAAFLAVGTVLSVTGSAWAADPEPLTPEEIAALRNLLSMGVGTASGASSIAVGTGASSTKGSAIAVGNTAQATGEAATAIGLNTVASGESSIAIGRDGYGRKENTYGPVTGPANNVWVSTTANKINSIAMGTAAQALGQASVSIGQASMASGQYAIATGWGAYAKGEKSSAYGEHALAIGKSSVAVGRDSKAFNNSSVAIGENANASYYENTDTGSGQVAVGAYSAVGKSSLGIGLGSWTEVDKSPGGIAIGGGTGWGGLQTRVYNSYYGMALGVNGYVNNSVAGTAVGALSQVLDNDGGVALGSQSISDRNGMAFSSAITDPYYGTDKEAKGGYDLSLPNQGYVHPSSDVLAMLEDYKSDKTEDKKAKLMDAMTWNSTDGVVAVGAFDESTNTFVTRQISGVAAVSADTDAVNVAQLKAAQVEIIAGDNVEVIKDTSSGHTKYTIHALNAIVEAGENIKVEKDTPDETTNSNGITTDVNGEEAGVTPAASANPIKPDKENNHTTTYTVSTTGGGGIAEISFNGDNKDAQIDNPKVLNIEGGATGELTDGNIGVESDGKDTLTIRLAKDIKDVDSITVNKNITVGGDTIIDGDGLTIKNGPKITKNNVDMGGQQIHNVAAGTADTDAVNVSQLRDVSGDIYNNINRMDSKIEKVGAGAAALAGLHPLDFDPDEKWHVAAGVGNYGSETAVALGAFYQPTDDILYNIATTVGDGRNMVSGGVSIRFGQKSHQSRSKKAMAKEIIELREEVAELKALVYDLTGKGGLDPSKTAIFPDTPENHWAYDYVAVLAGNGVLEGYQDGYFKGNRQLTRYEMAAIIYRLMSKGIEVDNRMLQEFAPELARVKVDTLTHYSDGTPHIQRVRIIPQRG